MTGRNRARYSYAENKVNFTLFVDENRVTRGEARGVRGRKRTFHVQNPETKGWLEFNKMELAKDWAIDFYDNHPGSRSSTPGFLSL